MRSEGLAVNGWLWQRYIGEAATRCMYRQRVEGKKEGTEKAQKNGLRRDGEGRGLGKSHCAWLASNGSKVLGIKQGQQRHASIPTTAVFVPLTMTFKLSRTPARRLVLYACPLHYRCKSPAIAACMLTLPPRRRSRAESCLRDARLCSLAKPYLPHELHTPSSLPFLKP